MAAEHIVALDAGTSGARCVVLRPGAGVVAAARRAWQYDTPPGGGPLGKCFDAAVFWSIVCDVTRRALAEAGIAGSDVAAIGVTSQRLGVVVIDAEGGVLFTSPNVDARAFMEGIAIDGTMAERVHASSGKLPSLLLAPARLHWLRKNDPAAFARADCILTIGDWIAYQLSGERKNERALASDCGLLDVTSRERDDRLLGELEVPTHLLAPLVWADEIAGSVSKSGAAATGLAAGTPVVIAGGDTQCALAGMGIDGPGEAGIAAGWSCPLALVTLEPRIDEKKRTWTDLHAVRDRWLIESSPADAGRTWQWCVETLLGEGDDVLDRAEALASGAPAGSGDAIALLGPGVMNAGAMGVHLGGFLFTTPLTVNAVGRPQLLRAALENIGFALRANLEQAEEVAGARATRLAAGGGMMQTPLFARILSDVIARPIEVAQDIDVTARGAALMAARAAGLDETSLRADMHTIEPDAANAQTYERGYARWRKLGQALDRTMQEQT